MEDKENNNKINQKIDDIKEIKKNSDSKVNVNLEENSIETVIQGEVEEQLNPISYLLEAGVQIATKTKSAGMKRFIYKVREDGLYLLDVKTINARIKIAASMIARYDSKDVIVTASRIYAIAAAKKFSEIINATFISGRVTPGIFTNPNKKDYMEKKLILISDSRNEKQAVKEASMENMSIIALCDTDNLTKFIDLIIPANNRGRRSLAYIYFLMAREILKQKGEIKSYEEFNKAHTVDEFEAVVEQKEKIQVQPDAIHQ
ncbi:MAG: 30S ribosomal protein S2 [Candidatus Marsarchaeota archaeon]|nr:30S ribosomal protein S2 [Candidatus Marsarchaeota archaeon]